MQFVLMGNNARHPLCFAFCCIIAGASMRKKEVLIQLLLVSRTAIIERANTTKPLHQTRPAIYVGTPYAFSGSARILASSTPERKLLSSPVAKHTCSVLLSLTNIARSGRNNMMKAEFRRLAAHTIGALARVIARLLAVNTLWSPIQLYL